MFEPMLRQGHEMPLEVMRTCPYCGYLPATRAQFPHGSVVVNFTRDFYLQCINRFCPHSRFHEPLPCFLKHRDYNIETMSMDLTDGLPLTEVQEETEVMVGRRRRTKIVTLLEPDFENRDYPDPTVQAGPHESCTGALTWADDSVSRETWLRCRRCAAQYHAFIFVSRGVLRLGRDEALHHGLFRFQIGEMDSRVGRPITRIVTQWVEGARNIRPIPPNLAMFIDRCVWQGRDITLAQAA